MNNFTYCNPVKIVFGKGAIAGLPDLLPANATVLLIYGGGSIKRNGVYDQVAKALRGRTWKEFGGIEPNPLHETCLQAMAFARKEKAGFLLAVGGGSVLDATKYIAAGCEYGGDPWDILAKEAEVRSALPLGCVLTLPATGSEMNCTAVISKKATCEKRHFASPKVTPLFSILDPETTFSLPTRQTVNGIVDAFVHVTEQYVSSPCNAPLQDRQAEAILLTLMEEAPKVLAHPADYDGRANLMWAATNALNGLIGCGVPQDWTTHMVGHELTALYGIDHAQSLAVVLPPLWRRTKTERQAKLAQMARRIFGAARDLPDAAVADRAIDATERFFQSLGMRTKLADYGIEADDAARRVAGRLKARSASWGDPAITTEVIADVLRQAQ